MAPRKMTMGVDAHVWCLSRFIHPSALIRDKFPNPVRGHKLDDMIVRRQEEKTINRKQVLAIVCIHESFKENDQYQELYAAPRYMHITQEGPEDSFFGIVPVAVQEDTSLVEGTSTLPSEVQGALRASPTDEDIALVRGQGIMVDDDNEPAPENEPTVNETTNSVFGDWDHFTGICPRKMEAIPNTSPRMIHFSLDAVVKPTKLQLFELLFPKKFIFETILPAINDRIEGNAVMFREFLQWLGIWFTMATCQGFSRNKFWSTMPLTGTPDQMGAPYRFNNIMSRYRFDAILRNIRYNMDEPPTFRDRFWEVRDLIKCWNDNMDEQFSSSWNSCLDESMSIWTNEYTCPGYMFVPRKPHPFGNEYHTICCCISGVLYRVELVEGKDRPPERGPEQYSDLGKTVGLLLRVTKPLHGTGKCVVLDSGFCVLEGIARLKEKGVFAAAQIKKRRYWPKHVDGNMIKAYFADKDVGSVAALPGKLNGIQVWIHCMKEPDYITMLMSNYGTLDRTGDTRSRSWKIGHNSHHASFKYPELVYRHYKNRHHVDDHNNRRHQPISLEETWATKFWPHRVFAFLLAVAEGNAYLLNKHYRDDAEDSVLAFRRALATELINNTYGMEEKSSTASKSRKRRSRTTHELCSLPHGKIFSGERMVASHSYYPQKKCISCKRKVRTYCYCSPGVMRCNTCFTEHVLAVEMDG